MGVLGGRMSWARRARSVQSRPPEKRMAMGVSFKARDRGARRRAMDCFNSDRRVSTAGEAVCNRFGGLVVGGRVVLSAGHGTGILSSPLILAFEYGVLVMQLSSPFVASLLNSSKLIE